MAGRQVIHEDFDSSLPTSIFLSSSRTPMPGKSTSVAASVYLTEPTKLAITAFFQAPHVQECLVLGEKGCRLPPTIYSKLHSCRGHFTIAPLRPMVANSLRSLGSDMENEDEAAGTTKDDEPSCRAKAQTEPTAAFLPRLKPLRARRRKALGHLGLKYHGIKNASFQLGA